MTEQENNPGLTLDQKTIDVLVAHIIPTSKYFEVRFDHVQQQIDRVNTDLLNLGQNVDKRFDSMQKDMDGRFDSMQKGMDGRFDSMQKGMDGRFEQVDKRFEQVNKGFERVDNDIKDFRKNVDMRFEQVDKRFEQVNTKLDKLLERIDVKIDAGLRENRAISIRLFSFAIMFSVISVVGMFGKLFKLF